MNNTLSITGLFLEGLLSFFTPCVLPLVPLYIGYLTSGIDQNASPTQKRLRTIGLTFFFVLGISTVFFLAGLGSSALRNFFLNQSLWFHLIGGVVLILFGLFSLGVIRVPFLEREHKVLYQTNGKMGFLQAYLLGFFFSFAWSPCVGPLLASAIVAAASASTRLMGWVYIGAYTLGFVCLFLLIGLFTEEVLHFLKEKRNIVKYTKILGGLVVIGMGIYMLYQGGKTLNALNHNATASGAETTEVATTAEDEMANEEKPVDMEDVNFTLEDANGKAVQLTDYRGKIVVVNFFGTWCYYCNEELPHLQELEETRDDIKILLVATPNLGQEKDQAYIEAYLAERGYTMDVLYDKNYEVVRQYGVSGYPSTFIFKESGIALGYIPGYVPPETMDAILEEAKK